MSESMNREIAKFLFGENKNTDVNSEFKSGNDDDTEVDVGKDYFWDVVVHFHNSDVEMIATISESLQLSFQELMERYISMGITADVCKQTGNYYDLEELCGLTKYKGERHWRLKNDLEVKSS